jgi:lipoprotein signal peptidase
MLNAFQIVNTFNYLETNAPGNVRQVMNNLNDMLELSALETDQITSSLFNFTETQSPGAGFTEMGNDSKVLTAFIGNLFYIGVVILLVYLLYGFVHGCGYSDRRCKRFDLWL